MTFFLGSNSLAFFFFKGKDVVILSSLDQTEKMNFCVSLTQMSFLLALIMCIAIFDTCIQGPRISHTDCHRLR